MPNCLFQMFDVSSRTWWPDGAEVPPLTSNGDSVGGEEEEEGEVSYASAVSHAGDMVIIGGYDRRGFTPRKEVVR